MMQACLHIRDLSLGYGDQDVLRIDHWQVGPGGVTALLGPVATGKSSLLRCVAGLDALVPSAWVEGDILLDDEPVPSVIESNPNAVAYLPQKARYFFGSLRENLLGTNYSQQQRNALAALLLRSGLHARLGARLDEEVGQFSLACHRAALILALLLSEPRLLLLDEPLSDVSMSEEGWLMEFIRWLGKDRTVIVVSHNKPQVAQMSDTVALVSGGRMIETGPTQAFFAQPSTEAGRQYLLSGSAWLPSADPAPSKPVPATPRRQRAPLFHSLGFLWIERHRLGGMHQPGLLGNLEGDLRTLAGMGVNVLVTLTEEMLDASAEWPPNLEIVHFPIADMRAPEPEAAHRLLGELVARPGVIVFHCRGGLGRTGLMLACFLILHDRISATQAVVRVRKVNPNYIQSQEQLDFIEAFGRLSG